MDITIAIMLPPRGDTDFSRSAHPRWQVLSIVTAYVPMATIDQVTHPTLGYVHVTGVPKPAAWSDWSNERIQKKICDKITAVWEDENRQVLGKRFWCGDGSSIPAGAVSNLLTNRQITVTWTQFKNFCLNLKEANRKLADQDLE